MESHTSKIQPASPINKPNTAEPIETSHQSSEHPNHSTITMNNDHSNMLQDLHDAIQIALDPHFMQTVVVPFTRQFSAQAQENAGAQTLFDMLASSGVDFYAVMNKVANGDVSGLGRISIILTEFNKMSTAFSASEVDKVNKMLQDYMNEMADAVHTGGVLGVLIGVIEIIAAVVMIATAFLFPGPASILGAVSAVIILIDGVSRIYGSCHTLSKSNINVVTDDNGNTSSSKVQDNISQLQEALSKLTDLMKNGIISYFGLSSEGEQISSFVMQIVQFLLTMGAACGEYAAIKASTQIAEEAIAEGVTEAIPGILGGTLEKTTVTTVSKMADKVFSVIFDVIKILEVACPALSLLMSTQNMFNMDSIPVLGWIGEGMSWMSKNEVISSIINGGIMVGGCIAIAQKIIEASGVNNTAAMFIMASFALFGGLIGGVLSHIGGTYRANSTKYSTNDQGETIRTRKVLDTAYARDVNANKEFFQKNTTRKFMQGAIGLSAVLGHAGNLFGKFQTISGISANASNIFQSMGDGLSTRSTAKQTFEEQVATLLKNLLEYIQNYFQEYQARMEGIARSDSQLAANTNSVTSNMFGI